ncbi:hypothetical protein C1H46_017141 [Malus baccata]|uniref:Uncharacterized protein n=1 Tax=Malus baccata TaxID=106549 RepID=A0A540MEY2_MALBA|nr:hypothetical protein C1H46_017141 [Malus baccata]
MDVELNNKWRVASRGNQTPSLGGNAAATSTPDMATTGVPPVPLRPTVSTTSLTSLVMHHVLSARRTHRRPWSSEEAQSSGEAFSVHGKGSQTGFRKCYCFREVLPNFQ